MELRDLMRVFKKRVLWIFSGLILGLLTSIFFSMRVSKLHFEASALLFVTRTAQAPLVDFYTYDGFHAQQTAYHYADTVIGLARHLGADRVVRRSEQLVEVTEVTTVAEVIPFRSDNHRNYGGQAEAARKKAEEDINNLVSKLIEASEKLNLEGDPEISIQLVGEVQVLEKKTAKIAILGFGLLGGLGFGTLLSSLKEYLS
jgi:hypothetical protein